MQSKPGRYFLVMGSGGWGRGITEAEATKNWRKNTFQGCKKTGPVKVVVLDVDRSAYVDEMGYVISDSTKEKPVKLYDKEVSVL